MQILDLFLFLCGLLLELKRKIFTEIDVADKT